MLGAEVYLYKSNIYKTFPTQFLSDHVGLVKCAFVRLPGDINWTLQPFRLAFQLILATVGVR